MTTIGGTATLIPARPSDCLLPMVLDHGRGCDQDPIVSLAMADRLWKRVLWAGRWRQVFSVDREALAGVSALAEKMGHA